MNGCYCSYLNPNDSYVIQTQKTAWDLLSQLNQIGNETIYSRWKQILNIEYNLVY